MDVGYPIIRVEKLKTSASVMKMLRHALREDKPPNAVPGASPPAQLAGQRTSAEGMRILREYVALAKKVPHGWMKHRTVHGLDILVSASRNDMLNWTKSQQDQYFADALAFIEQKFGGAQNVLAATIHRDESTPHMQVVLVPVNHHGRFSAASMVGGPKKLSALQDSFHQAIGAPRGLLRGIKNTRARHVSIRKLYSAMEAGADPPKIVQVPPAPSMLDRLKPDYQAKLKAHDDALRHNARERKRLDDQAELGRRMHPEIISRQARRYRHQLHLADLAKQMSADKEAAAMDRAKLHHQITEVQMQARAADAIWKKSGGQMLDKLARVMDRELMQRVRRQLGIPQLQHGESLLDQLCKAGKARTLIEAAAMLNRTLDDQTRASMASGHAAHEGEQPGSAG